LEFGIFAASLEFSLGFGIFPGMAIWMAPTIYRCGVFFGVVGTFKFLDWIG